jgi:hypothetical protein
MERPNRACTSRLATSRLLRRLYTSNPFYVISADLVFVGLRLSFDTGGDTFQAGALMVALLGYTLLLATTACLLIRFGKVWDDARTLLLLVVAMFLATSVTFDETLAGSPRLGVALYLGGLIFAVLVSEGLLRGIRLRLPPLFRLPYYLILALFFLYPVALTPLLRDPDSPVLRWLLFGFSPLAGLAFLSLIPAVRRGPGYVSKNGSPWRHPLYPWTLFGLLGAAVCGRAFYLCVSLHFVGMSRAVGRFDTIFGPYFLVPFLLALDVLLLEAGLALRNRATQRAAVLALPGVVTLAVIGHRPDPVYQGFLGLFVEGLGGTPLFLTVVAAVAISGYAALRRVPLALGGLTVFLLALTVVGPGSLHLDGLVAPQPLPLLAVAALQFVPALRQKDSRRCLIGAACLIAATTIALGRVGLGDHQGPLVFHLAVLAAMLIGAFLDDPLARLMQRAGALLLGFAGLDAVWGGIGVPADLPPELARVYALLPAVAAAGYGYLTGCRPYFAAASLCALVWLTIAGWRGYCDLRRAVVGLDWIVSGLAFFALAAGISLAKTGLLARRHGRRFRDAVEQPLGGTE